MNFTNNQGYLSQNDTVEGTSSLLQVVIQQRIAPKDSEVPKERSDQNISNVRQTRCQAEGIESTLEQSQADISRDTSSVPEQNVQFKQAFACTQCDYHATKKDHLKRHTEIKHNKDHTNTFFCEVCRSDGVLKSFPWKYELARHIKSHTGSSRPLILGDKVTWKPRTAEMHRARAKYQPEQGKEKEYHEIRLLALSYPSEFRYSGGLMTKGPFADETVPGMPRVFNTQGKLRDKYHFLHDSIKEMRNKRTRYREKRGLDELTPADAPRKTRPSRRCKPKPAVPLPPAHASELRRRTQTHSSPSSQTMIPTASLPDGFFNNRQFTELKEPLYFPSEFKGHRPNYWPKGWAWPENPTHIPHDENQCEFCNDRICDCIEKVMPIHAPHIEPFGEKGEGLRATTAYGARGGLKKRSGELPSIETQEAIYRKGDFLGQLTGKLVPVDSMQSHGYVLELKRDDLPGNPILAWVDMLDCGNFVRKANHACSGAKTAFENHRISGKYRVMLVALMDIYEGDEITVNYGEGYWEENEIKCLCGSEDCISKQQVGCV